MHILTLGGCSPSTLALYLKALGIFRLVSEQIDPSARAWWDGERFKLATAMDTGALESFFLDHYSPTPLVSPWNRGSGFFTQNDKGLAPVEHSVSHRFETLRRVIEETKNQLGETTKNDLGDKQTKARLILNCRLQWREMNQQWLDAAIVIGGDGEAKYPSMLGSGGNDGNLEFSNNFLQRLNDLFALETEEGGPRQQTHSWLRGALWGTPANQCQKKKAIGQFFPGTAGGANSTNGPAGESLLNPFDFVLMLEGAVSFRANTTKKMGSRQTNRAAVPFYVETCATGYPSASQQDEGAQGEQWLPLWGQPLSYREFRHLLAEGKAQLGTRPAQDPVDLARAVASLGVSRGIRAFQRFGYIERNGQSNFAVPLGRFDVPERTSPKLACLEDLDTWVHKLRRAARDKHATGRLALAERRLSEAILAATRQPEAPSRWQALLLSMGAVEAALRVTADVRCGFIPTLRPEWVQAADDGQAEFRLAVAFGLQSQARRHWLPRKHDETAVVMQGRCGCDDAIAFVRRRLVEASQKEKRQLVMYPATRAGAHLFDLSMLLKGEARLDRILALARPLMAIGAREWKRSPCPPKKPSQGELPPDAWMMLRLPHHVGPLETGETVRCDPAILRRLEAGDLPSATALASRRLRAAGLPHAVGWAQAPAATCRLWTAALAFPITTPTASFMGRFLDPKTKDKNHDA